MDLKSLSNIKDVTFETQEPVDKKAILSEYFAQKVSDSVSLPVDAKARENYITERIKNIISCVPVSADELAMITDSLKKIIGALETKVNKVTDSLEKAKEDLASEKAKNVKLSKIVDSNEPKVDVATRRMTVKLKAYEKIGTVQQIVDKIKDSEESELRAQEIENLKKQLELQSAQSEEEKKALLAQIEEKEAALAQKGITDSVDPSILARFAEAMESWINTGSEFVADQVRALAEKLGNSSIKTLVDKALDYSLSREEYQELVGDLKKELTEAHLAIPSIALITDSFDAEEQNEGIAESKVAGLAAHLTNLIINPNDENVEAVRSATGNLELAPLVDLITDLLQGKKVPQSLISHAYKLFLKEKNVPVAPVILGTPVVTSTDLLSGINPTLDKQQYQTITDAVSRLRSLKEKSKIKIKDSQLVYPQVIEGSDVLAVNIDGFAHLVIPADENKTTLDLFTEIQQGNVTEESVIDVLQLMKEATDVKSYDIVTDSLLYKRRLTDSYWTGRVTDPEKDLIRLRALVGPVVGVNMKEGDVVLVSDSEITDKVVNENPTLHNKPIERKVHGGYYIAVIG